MNLDIHYLCTGIGNYKTIFTLTQFLTQHQASDFFLLNIGVCGYMSQSTPPPCIQIGRTKNLHTQKELLPPLALQYAPIASIYCSEVPVVERPYPEKEGFVDMESWAVEVVAEQFKIPRLLLKVPIDKVGKATIDFDKNFAIAQLAKNIDYAELMRILMQKGLKSDQ